MGVLANTFRIARRTHDYNEIQNKQSKPERLTSPKLYIEEIGTKGKSRSILLPVRHTGVFFNLFRVKTMKELFNYMENWQNV